MTPYPMDYLHTEAIRLDAVYWLRRNVGHFPMSMDTDISNKMYGRFRFIRCLDGEIVFGDCIVSGITEEEFYTL